MKAIQAIRGMKDIPPAETPVWRHLEDVAREVLAAYGYQELRPPMVEKTELFRRSVGEGTDIVEKEMYTFADRNGESLTLRPECTASCVRAAIEHGWLRGAASACGIWDLCSATKSRKKAATGNFISWMSRPWDFPAQTWTPS